MDDQAKRPGQRPATRRPPGIKRKPLVPHRPENLSYYTSTDAVWADRGRAATSLVVGWIRMTHGSHVQGIEGDIAWNEATRAETSTFLTESPW